jgi:ribosomal protein RSM22 (predicted rRNA methylase)
MPLPEPLSLAIEERFVGVSRSKLRRVAVEMSERYREHEGGRPSRQLVDSDDAVLAYLAVRLPGTFAALQRAMAEVASARPDFRPASHLDLGAGPGTAFFAAAGPWPGIEATTLVEADERFVRMGSELLRQPQEAPRLSWLREDLAGSSARWSTLSADLVTMSYVLSELDAHQAEDVVRRAMASTVGVLLIVEPGTTRAFEALRVIRTRLIAEGAYVVAPCPHLGVCPMVGGDWCHFATRLSRSKLHREVKGGTAPFEHEAFAYLALSPDPVPAPLARVLRRPRVTNGFVELQLCGSEGLERRSIPRRDKAGYRHASRLDWGDALPANPL